MKEYRLVQLLESIDNLTKEEILIFELSPIQYNLNRTGYDFNSEPSLNNHFFIFPNDKQIEEQFLKNAEEIIEINLDDFNSQIIKTPEGIRKTFFSKEISKSREKKDFWYSNAIEEIKNDKQIGFSFSHIESATFTYGPDYDNNNSDLIPSEYCDIELEQQENYIIIDKDSTLFCFRNPNGILTRIKGKTTSIESDQSGRIIKVETLSNWALTDDVTIHYDFNKIPLKPLQKSERNAVITVFGDKYEPIIKMQWTLSFGNYMGAIQFN